MNVDFAAVDQGTSAGRIRQKSLPSQGGWHVIVNGYFGVDCADPTSKHFRANGDEPTNGWAQTLARPMPSALAIAVAPPPLTAEGHSGE